MSEKELKMFDMNAQLNAAFSKEGSSKRKKIEWQGNIYRIFFCYDEGHIVILFNGFQKKTQKTPDREIDKALKLKKEYYERKRTKDV